MRNFFAKLEQIDVRLVYLFFALAAMVPFIVQVRLPVFVTADTLGVYNTIDSCPDDQVILMDSTWDAFTRGECAGQCKAAVEHMLEKGIKFVVVSINNPQGPEFFEQVITSDSVQEIIKRKKRKYGVDWVHLGFQVAGVNFSTIQALAKSIPGTFPTDYFGTPVNQIPLMRNVRTIRDVHMVYAITYAPPEQWISYVRGVYGTPVAFGAAGIMSSAYYPYLDSGQLTGMLAGVRGAAEYESLVHSPGLGSLLIVPQAFCHTLIILLVVLGNVGFFLTRKRNEKAARQ